MYILLKTFLFHLPSGFGRWNRASSVRGRKKCEVALISFVLFFFLAGECESLKKVLALTSENLWTKHKGSNTSLLDK